MKNIKFNIIMEISILPAWQFFRILKEYNVCTGGNFKSKCSGVRSFRKFYIIRTFSRSRAPPGRTVQQMIQTGRYLYPDAVIEKTAFIKNKNNLLT